MEWYTLWLLLVLLAGAIAKNKGRSVVGWTIATIILAPFAMLVLIVLPSLKSAPENS